MSAKNETNNTEKVTSGTGINPAAPLRTLLPLHRRINAEPRFRGHITCTAMITAQGVLRLSVDLESPRVHPEGAH
jgi:hypothetical protein